MTYDKMDPVRKAEWCEALRSGRYKQGQKYLCNAANEFCCLGVLADITPGRQWDHRGEYSARVLFEESCKLYDLLLPAEVLSNPAQVELSNMNDGTGPIHGGKQPAPFSVIAQWIEENL
jgi:hypothetical protein